MSTNNDRATLKSVSTSNVQCWQNGQKIFEVNDSTLWVEEKIRGHYKTVICYTVEHNGVTTRFEPCESLLVMYTYG